MDADYHSSIQNPKGKTIQTTSLGLAPRGSTIAARYKMRMAMGDVGEPLAKVKTLRQFLCVIYDVCAAQRNLHRKCKILCRGISDNNILVTPDNCQYYKPYTEGHDEVKYLNQVLAKDNNVAPKPACMLVDLEHGAKLEMVQAGPEALVAGTGMPKFIARSVCHGELLKFDQHPSILVSMPELEGRALDLYKFSQTAEHYQRFTQMVQRGNSQIDAPQAQFTHQLFHDAESVFWVAVWVLARSASPIYREEIQWSRECWDFALVMQTHSPPRIFDNRNHIMFASPQEWANVLHPDLKCMAPMLNEMRNYIMPEWGFRPELDVEHVHEALMRLLLTEIVRIDEENRDISLAVGIRSLPHE